MSAALFFCWLASAEMSLVAPSLFDIKGGGTPSAGSSIVQGELGFSSLPSIAYHYAVLDALTIGARFSFDYQYDTPNAPFSPNIFLQAPLRISALRHGRLSLGVHFDPGVGMSFSPQNAFIASTALFDVLLGAGADVAYHIVLDEFVIGGGLDMPIAVAIPITTGVLALHWPLLWGPIFEYHPVPALALTLDTKLGPLFSAPGSVVFALRLLAGVAYRF